MNTIKHKTLHAGLLIIFAATMLLVRAASGSNPEPEWMDYGRMLAQNESHIYFARQPDFDTNTCLTNPNGVIYGRFAHGGEPADVEQLENGCDAIRVFDMAITDSHTYYVYSAPGDSPQIYRIPLTGGVPELLHQASQKVIAKDDTHIYFFAPGQLVRFAQADPTTLELIWSVDTAPQFNAMKVDATDVYWTESTDANTGAVRRIAKTGGSVNTVASASVLIGAKALALTDSHVYWSELGGRLVRRPKGPGVEDLLYQNDEPINGIGIDGDLLAFTRGLKRGGSVWRMHSGGGPVTLMAFDQPSPRDVKVSDGQVYWTTHSSVYRLPEDAEATPPDYVIDKIEITQGIQDGLYTVPLGRRKLTYVRVYSRDLAGPALTKVTGVLHGYKDGVELPGSPVTAVSPAVDPESEVGSRLFLSSSLVFALPRAWVEEDHLAVVAEINPVVNGQRGFESDYDNNFYPNNGAQVSLTMHDRFTCLITMGAYVLDGNGGGTFFDPASPQFDAHLARAESLLPGRLLVEKRPWVIEQEPGVPLDMSKWGDGRDIIMSKINEAKSWENLSVSCPSYGAVFAALIHSDAETKDRGANEPGTNLIWTRMKSVEGGDVREYNKPKGGVTLAHEIGHALNRDHVDCGDPGGDLDESYPYPSCKIENTDSEEAHWGFDGLTQSVISGHGEAGDLMSYNDHRWTSDYTWRALHDEIGAPAMSRAEERAPTSDGLWVEVVLRADGGNELGTAYHVPMAMLTDAQRESLNASMELGSRHSPYAIELLDTHGDVLSSQPIPVPILAKGQSATISHAVIPYNEAATFMRLVHMKGQRDPVVVYAGGASPVVQVFANPVGDNLQIATNAIDPDGDTLKYIYQYSANDGATWQVLAIDIADNQYSVALDALPGTTAGSESRVRAIVSDGIHTGIALSAPFSVTRKQPVAVMLSPTEDEFVDGGHGYLLRGAGYDLETTNEGSQLNFSWHIDGELVGVGEWLSVELTPGEHAVELRVHDADQTTGSDWAWIQVQ